MTGHIPFAKAEAWLRANRALWLATTRPDGRAHAVPVWFVWEGGRLYFATSRTSQKRRNLDHVPWAVAHLGDGDDTLIVEGPVEAVEDPTEIARGDAAFRHKYVDPHSGATAGYPGSEQDIPYRLDPQRVMIWEYGVVDTRTDFAPADWAPPQHRI